MAGKNGNVNRKQRLVSGVCKLMVKINKRTGENTPLLLHSVDMPGGIRYNSFYIHNRQEAKIWTVILL